VVFHGGGADAVADLKRFSVYRVDLPCDELWYCECLYGTQEDITMKDADQNINSCINDLYRTAIHLTAGNRSRAARMVRDAVTDVWQDETRISSTQNPKTSLFRALIRRGRQANSWPHCWWERSISAAFSDVTNEPEIIRALNALPLPLREAILLVDGMGFRYPEACAALDVDRKTLVSRLHEARTDLDSRAALTPYPGLALARAVS